ncbi:4-hydroxy-tetrahydrodipicolinate reductase [Methanosalsum natronophilum]|uniref:4-hydroxy-tetrahydrodipicolinate reductase n=1 Tax=Methanosalsum natronophilum TaxID=768733 RepID=A0A424YQD5_9EURY|nr:4-hydroxy-tetrahydrodipicolinate reductase [Methanosalsum natronophilum]MCS3924800.1 4-hydroxy-tetrahydrodipicolinate reductase [Methanosalsum natronophilum]RQD81181.1 MAG: 4-hydroxy-tetrahydrodipicolinate reductase [Methanosalsum natronophilum]
MIKVGVTGASGRMGGMLISNIIDSDKLELTSAFDISNIGMDAGEIATGKKLDVPISSAEDMENVLNDSGTQVLIDFTIANATVENAPIAAKSGVKMVIGTTGFSDEQRTIIDSAIRENNVAAIISPNYAVGVNVFFKLLQEAAQYLHDYDIEIFEAHHNQKKDAPSGTAKGAAEAINKVIKEKEFVYGREGYAPRGNEIGIHAIRGGDIVGDHTALFAGTGERIEIKHQAHSRQAFVSGAIKAAEWIHSKEPGIYDMNDMLGF